MKINAVILALAACVPSAAQTAELKYVVIVSRHGVRAPTWTPDRLNRYATSPWPDFGVPPGNLTTHGRELMKMMGGYYRELYTSQNLLGPGCASAGRTWLYSDTDQRTLETARSLGEGLLPGCKVEIHSAAAGATDPLFDPIESGDAKPDPALSLAAVKGRIGPQLDALVDAHRPALDLLNRILNGNGKAASSIFDQPMSLTASETGAAMAGPLNTASTFTENLLLEYADGMKGDKLGWGRLTQPALLQIIALHTAYADIIRRTPYLARVRSSNMLSHILQSLQQAVNAKPVKGALGPPETSLLVISGHDTNISNISGMLNLSWLLPGYQPDDAPPGGALIFSLWRSQPSGQYSVRLQFVAQTLDQMHNGTPLSLAVPPPAMDVFIPGCSTSAAGYACDWSSFARTATTAIAPEFVKP